MHGTALMLSALSLQEIGLLIEALALDYNAGQDAAIQLEIVQTAEGGWLIRARGWNKRA
jgi:hypothetical protein